MVERRAVLLAAVLLAPGGARAQSVDRVFPLDPGDRAIVGTRPTFQLGVEGSDIGKMRFRVELSRNGFETIAHTFDQQAEPTGWIFTALNGENGAAYRVRSPLGDGPYQWRVSAWNGTDWVPGKETRVLRVDGVPPADVGPLDMDVDPVTKGIVLEWKPVTVDREGRPESVARYKVYRYEKRSMFFSIRAFEIGETETSRFVDASRKAADMGLLFYKVTAVDEAGNEFERRY